MDERVASGMEVSYWEHADDVDWQLNVSGYVLIPSNSKN